MRQVTELYRRHEGADVYVVGTGTSMRVFPVEFLETKVTIGLNRAWKLAPLRYAITLAPHTHVPEFLDGEPPHPEITWITKAGKARAVLTPEQYSHAERNFYSFDIGGREPSVSDDWVIDTGRVLEWVRRPSGSMLYQWSSISQTAVNLAANMGARNVILVGCDNTSLLGQHHAIHHHTKWLGREPDERYLQYHQGLVEVREALRSRGVNLVSVSPFLRLGDPTEEFLSLARELSVEEYVPPGPDISEIDHPRRFGRGGQGSERSVGTKVYGRARKALSRARMVGWRPPRSSG